MKIRQDMFFQWMILPLVILWLILNYFVGLTRNPQWGMITATHDDHVLGDTSFMPSYSWDAYKWDGKALITLWFDDAWNSQYLEGHPLLAAKGMRGVIAVPTRSLGFEAYASWAQIKRLQYAGWEVASHSREHSCEPETLSAEELLNELKGSLFDLQSHQLVVNHFVAPCGVEYHVMTQLLSEHYLSQRLTDAGINPLPVTNPYHLLANSISSQTTLNDVDNWIGEAREENGWLNLVFHQIDDSGAEYSTTPELFAQIIELVERSELEVVLPSEVFMLIRE